MHIEPGGSLRPSDVDRGGARGVHRRPWDPHGQRRRGRTRHHVAIARSSRVELGCFVPDDGGDTG